jgi:sterol 3beta-glucosyltransferase
MQYQDNPHLNQKSSLMRLLITNFGTRGDFEPFFALAGELAAHQHEPIFAIPESAVSMLKQSGFSYAVIAADDPELRDKINLSWSTNADAYEARGRMAEEFSILQSYLPAALKELMDLSSTVSLLVSGPAQPLARIVHETTGIPFVSVQISHFGGNGGPAIREAGDKLVNPFRRKIGLPPVKDPFTTGANSPQLALYAMSRYLRPRPATWPSHYQMTGFFFADSVYHPPPELTDFLKAGAPPVVVTLGSMPHQSPELLLSIILEALRLSGSRALIQGFDLPSGELPDDATVYGVGYVPHSWLFRFASCVVTHGGAGTAAAVFRSGVPGVFIPHSEVYDQRYWSQLAYEYGCTVPAIPIQKLDPTTLAQAIMQCSEDRMLRKKAADLGIKIRSERGVDTARQMIESMIASFGLS